MPGKSDDLGRAYPLMRPELRAERRLTPEEAAGWLARVKPEEQSDKPFGAAGAVA